MTDEPAEAHIYLADTRACTASADWRCCPTCPTASGPGSLRSLTEISLRAGATVDLSDPVAGTVVLLPLLGGLDYGWAQQPGFLMPGEAATGALPADTSLVVSNPYQTETITFLLLRLAEPPDERPVSQTAFDGQQTNVLLPVATVGPVPARLLLGRFGGRQTGTYAVTGAGHTLFVWVIQGAFEAANRLLHARDGLMLRYDAPGELALEALSDGAMLLLVDLGATTV